MPIDTAAKRRSAAGVPFLPLGPGVTPDAAKPVAWRQQSAWGYSGVSAGAPVVVVPAARVVFGLPVTRRQAFGLPVCRRKEF